MKYAHVITGFTLKSLLSQQPFTSQLTLFAPAMWFRFGGAPLPQGRQSWNRMTLAIPDLMSGAYNKRRAKHQQQRRLAYVAGHDPSHTFPISSFNRLHYTETPCSTESWWKLESLKPLYWSWNTGFTAAACRLVQEYLIEGELSRYVPLSWGVGGTCYTQHTLIQFKQQGLDHQQASELAH
eukprot:1160616-Pelagomonas_calceolata.AAC.2